MNIIEATILGLVQGLTEFIPVSSSGHLVLVRQLFNFEAPGLFFDVILHLGTLLAVLIYFRADIIKIIKGAFKGDKIIWLLAIGTLPAFFVGYLVSDYVEALDQYPRLVALFMILTGVIFLLAERYYSQKNNGKKTAKDLEKINFKDAAVIGLAQALALFPGVSRSGITISTGLFRKINRQEAARFSFLLAIPAILGAGVYSLISAFMDESESLSFDIALFIGFCISFVSGYLAISFLLKYLKKNGLQIFSAYLFAVGIIILIIFTLR